MKRCFSCLFIIAVLIIASFIYVNLQFSRENPNPQGDKIFVIEAGQSLSEIAGNLQQEGFLEKPFFFKLYAIFKGVRTDFNVGQYMLNTQMSIKGLVHELTKERILRQEVKITILEGWKNKEIANYLESKNLFSAEKFLDYVAVNNEFNYEFLYDKPNSASLEGYLYPDTYRVFDDATPEIVVEKMLGNFDDKLTNELREEINRQGKDIYEVLTLASIVEKEMYGYENRQIVAGIFWNRLNDNYPLQSDATVNYITEKGTTRPSLEDTELDNPYNTYKNNGLPPGPICNPSIESIKAVVFPQETEYYFFLTTPDGEIIFSKTHAEHIENRNKYLE